MEQRPFRSNMNSKRQQVNHSRRNPLAGAASLYFRNFVALSNEGPPQAMRNPRARF
jgi:hypothetical protein